MCQAAAKARLQQQEAPKVKGEVSLSLSRVVWVVGVSILFTVVSGVWVKQAEVVVLSAQVTEAVPPVPAVGVLLVLLLVNPALRLLHPKLALTRAELLIVYCFSCISLSMPGCGIIRFLIALIPSAIYFATPENQFEMLKPHLPAWLVPEDFEVVRGLYEGSDTGQVPWAAWMVPILSWGLFFLLVWLTMLGLSALLRRQWIERERLTFPLLFLPFELTGLSDSETGVPFLRNRLMWIGFAASSIYNIMNMVNAYNPTVPCPGKYFDLGALFTERPLDAVRPFTLHYRPEMVGFGYLVSTEVAFSIWFFYLLLKVEAVVGRMLGLEYPGYPYDQEQSIGAYISLAVFFIYIARQQVWEAARMAWGKENGKGKRADSEEQPLYYRLAILASLFGFVSVCLFAFKAGMAWWVSLTFFTVVLLVAFVYARIRAEVGIPLIWMFPFYQSKKVLLYTLGSTPFMRQGGLRSLTVFALMTFMARGYYPSLMGYQVESFKVASVARIGLKVMSAVAVLAMLVGFLVGFYFHLTPYYHYGGGVLRGGIWGTGLAMAEYQAIINYVKAPVAPDVPRIVATGWGLVLTSILIVVRMQVLNFPVHPLGFGMAGAYGHLIWWSFFLVWLIKVSVLRIGGVRLYRQLVPAFVGFALGHYFTAGLVWGLWSVTGHEIFTRYAVWFG